MEFIIDYFMGMCTLLGMLINLMIISIIIVDVYDKIIRKIKKILNNVGKKN